MDAEARIRKLPFVPAAEAGSKIPENATDEDHVPKQVHQFYFIKLHAYENPNLIDVENLLPKLDQDRILTIQKRRRKSDYRDNLRRNNRAYYRSQNREWHPKISYLQLLQVSLDKLCFANNSSRGRAIRPNSTVKEIDHHGLHFGLLHASKSMAEERRILSKIKEVGKISKHSFITMEDYNDQRSVLQRKKYRWNLGTDEKRQIHQEIEKLDQAHVEAIFNAALNGKMWNSLGSKENIEQEIKSQVACLEERIAVGLKNNAKGISAEKELEMVENDVTSSDKQLDDIGGLKYEARECISLWRAEQEEKNASYDKYIELMRNARELVERKDIEALHKSSHEEVEKFMFQWSNDKAFRDEYRTRSIASLNKRCLTVDGRSRNRDEQPIFVKEPAASVSKDLRKALQKHQKETFRKPMSCARKSFFI